MVSLVIDLPSYALTYDKGLLRKTLRQAGAEVAASARKIIRSTVGQGRQYGQHRASAPGQAPASWSGALATSMKVVTARNGESVRVVDSQYYALALEAGAVGGGGTRGSRNKKATGPATNRVMQPRPYLSAALEACESDISKRIAVAVTGGVAFKPLKMKKTP